MTDHLTTEQTELDQANTAFWDELCGTGLARSLGIEAVDPDALRRFTEMVLAIAGVAWEKDPVTAWLRYIQLPPDMPPSLIHLRIAQTILDRADESANIPVWTERLEVALARALRWCTDAVVAPADGIR